MKGGRQALPGWKETILPLKSDSLFWHSVWISAGRPAGALHKVMSQTRNKYHSAVKKAKRKLEHGLAEDILVAAESGDVALMREMRKTIKKKTSAQAVPECLEGKVTPDTVLDKFRECYEELYNSANTSDVMNTIKQRLEEKINISSLEEVSKITGDIVKQACTNMKPGKIDVTEGYSSDALLHGPDSLFELLACVF